MEKTFSLDAREAQTAQQLDQERTQALAAIGALSLDMEQARKNLDGAAERQRAFVRATLAARNIDQFDNARVANGALVVTLPDEQAPMGDLQLPPPPQAEKTNSKHKPIESGR